MTYSTDTASSAMAFHTLLQQRISACGAARVSNYGGAWAAGARMLKGDKPYGREEILKPDPEETQ